MNLLLATVIPFIITLVAMQKFIPMLKRLKFGQTIYEKGPAHAKKQGTPNMGGVLFGTVTVVSTIVATILYYFFQYNKGEDVDNFWHFQNTLYPLLFVVVGSMTIGFLDDYIKDVKKRHDGLSPKQKIIGQTLVGILFSTYCYFFVGSDILLPFTQKTLDFGILYIPLMTLVVIFMTNSANLQDGLDGLLSSVTIVAMGAFLIITTNIRTMPGINGEGMMVLSFACSTLLGAILGFFCFNRYPAKIFMGDTGSMFVGGMMVGVAMLTKTVFPMVLICFTCIMSSVSVMMQVTYFKLTKGKRIFKMSPIHHHFELCDMSENQIVVMYCVISIILSSIAIFSINGFMG